MERQKDQKKERWREDSIKDLWREVKKKQGKLIGKLDPNQANAARFAMVTNPCVIH